MEDMQAVYDEEVNGSSSGLMSLMRGTGDMVLGEDIMDNLPMLLRAMEGTNKDTLTMEQIRDMSGPLDESSFSMQLSNTPGLESLVGPEIGLALGAVGGGGKGKSIKEILEEIQRLGGRMASDRDMDATRYFSEENLPEFLKSFSQLQRERRGREGFENMKDDLLDERATEYFEGPQGLKAINIDRRNLQRIMDEDPQVAPREMASGGRPGLYANINAKRKRIAAGSGERMRKKGEEGAPTAKNFRDSAKTAKKAHGGSLGYMKGYYGKSYK